MPIKRMRPVSHKCSALSGRNSTTRGRGWSNAVDLNSWVSYCHHVSPCSRKA